MVWLPLEARGHPPKPQPTLQKNRNHPFGFRRISASAPEIPLKSTEFSERLPAIRSQNRRATPGRCDALPANICSTRFGSLFVHRLCHRSYDRSAPRSRRLRFRLSPTRPQPPRNRRPNHRRRRLRKAGDLRRSLSNLSKRLPGMRLQLDSQHRRRRVGPGTIIPLRSAPALPRAEKARGRPGRSWS